MRELHDPQPALALQDRIIALACAARTHFCGVAKRWSQQQLKDIFVITGKWPGSTGCVAGIRRIKLF